jgi:hypothetical protein
MDMEVLVTRGDKWRFNVIYGEVRTKFKYKSWVCWVCSTQKLQNQFRGFARETLMKSFSIMRKRGHPKNSSLPGPIQGLLGRCDLHDLGFIGDVFTWKNKQTKGSTHMHT